MTKGKIVPTSSAAKAGTVVRSSPNLSTDFPATPTGYPYKDAFDFINGKRVDDEVPVGLHRVHDKLYDLREFKHPGGDLWLNLTKKTDITELFETHHIDYGKATKMLAQYEVQRVGAAPLPPRRSLLTFNTDGFYATLREKVFQQHKDVHYLGPALLATRMADILVVASLCMTIASGFMSRHNTTAAAALALAAGILNGFFIGIGHNFLHQRSNFRRFYLELSGFSTAEFRMHHALSHHPYTNTCLDAEVCSLLPEISFFPMKKGWVEKLTAIIMLPLICAFGIPFKLTLRLLQIALNTWPGELEEKVAQLIPMVQLLLLSHSILPSETGLLLWLLMFSATSGLFLWWNFLNGPHFNDECWHQGDTLDCTDWGILQIQTTTERSEMSSRDTLLNNLLNIPTFGLHHLHHLFPTIDATELTKLVPLFDAHCVEHGVVFQTMDNKSLAEGLFRCIITAYEQPNTRTRNGVYSAGTDTDTDTGDSNSNSADSGSKNRNGSESRNRSKKMA